MLYVPPVVRDNALARVPLLNWADWQSGVDVDISFNMTDGALSSDWVQERVDTVLMGRVGWSEWAGYWPKAEQDLDFAQFINGVPKHVASSTLTSAVCCCNRRSTPKAV